jgi:pilus assembly protein TadC
MRSGNGVTIIRTVIAVILVALGIGALSSGRVVGGVLLLGLAACNVALTITMRRRRAELQRRFPNFASRMAGQGQGQAPGQAQPQTPGL